MPCRIREIRYAHNPATFSFTWNTGSVPLDLTIRALIESGRQIYPALKPAISSQSGILLLTLSVEQMKQLLTLSGGPLVIELGWSGLVQVLLEVRSSLTELSTPAKPTVIGLPESVRYEIDSNVAGELAAQGAASALLSADQALDSQQIAQANATNATSAAASALASKNAAKTSETNAAQAAETAVQVAGNIMTFVGKTQYGVLLGLGGSIQYTQNENRYKTISITLL